jgi:hypothetical protein
MGPHCSVAVLNIQHLWWPAWQKDFRLLDSNFSPRVPAPS